MNTVHNEPRQAPQPSYLTWWLRRLIGPLSLLVVGLLLIVAVGFAQRIGWLQGPTTGHSTPTRETSADFTCPMHPQIRQTTADRCPICGMALVQAVTAGGADLDELSVKIEPAQRRLANIQTASVQFEPVRATINTVGSIAIDESRLATVASYIDGRIERLFADYTGVQVAERDHLAIVYSPELFTAQVEYLENRSMPRSPGTLAAVRDAREALVKDSRRKLQELGLQEEQLRELEESGTAKARQTVYTPIGGTVIEKLAMEGKYVKAGEPIYRIADLSTVWLKLELYPEDAARVRFGQTVEARVTSLPDQIFHGRVAFIDPTIDEHKRSVGVRVEYLNPEGKLRPGDYADATIYLPIGQQGEVYDQDLAGKWISPMHPQIIRDAPGPCPICGMDLVSTERYGYATQPVDQPSSLHIPRSAVLMAGEHSVVYVETEPGRFQIRKVTLGPILRDKVIILQGLEANEIVATNGNFLIDSQMQLAGKPSLIDPTRAQPSPTPVEGPLSTQHLLLTQVSGDTAKPLEDLYQSYFRIQADLANDKRPTEADAQALRRFATTLRQDDTWPAEARKQLAEIAKYSEHLHHLELDQARHQAFRPISHAIVALAALVRDPAGPPFQHMYCPMVKGGRGDWLQANDDLRNPYYGSAMLNCGEVVQTLPSSPSASMAPPDHSHHMAPVAPDQN